MPQRDHRRPGAEMLPRAAPVTAPTTSAGAGGDPATTVPADVVLVDHHDSYTWNLAHLIAAVTGRLPRVVQHDEVTAGDVLRHEFVVLSPGPGHPADRRDFSAGADVLRAGSRPVLGVCLGMQGMVTTFGGSVRRRAPAHGEVARIEHDGRGVYAGLPQGFAAVRYHSLQGVELPDCLLATAWCDGEGGAGVDPDGRQDHHGEGRALMGVRHASLPIEGVQFHPESILSERGADLVRNFLLGQDAGRAR